MKNNENISNNTIVIKINDEKSQEIIIEDIDNNKYENKKTSDKFNWFNAICFLSLMIIGIFLGIIFCCLCILFV